MTTTTHATATSRHRPHHGRIVVGVDGSAESRRALAWAVEQAARSRAEIEAVSVYSTTAEMTYAFGGYPAANPITPALAREAAERELESMVHSVLGRAEVEVHRITISDGSPSRALTEVARNATMLVVGAHHRSGWGLLLGSTAGSCVRHATCPVVVVPVTCR